MHVLTKWVTCHAPTDGQCTDPRRVLWLQRSFHLRTLLRQRTLRALSGAFLALESAVRLTLTPLPALLRHLSCEPEAAGFFEGVTANLARGEPLASAWEHAAKTLPIAARERETVSRWDTRSRG